MTLKYFFLNFCSALNKVNDLMYIAGDMNVAELVTLLREELVCSHASLLIFSNWMYSDVLNDCGWPHGNGLSLCEGVQPSNNSFWVFLWVKSSSTPYESY